MTPTVFSFNGVKIIIFLQDHDPIHIHAQYADYETIFELYFDCGKLSNILTRSADKEALPPQIHKKVVKFIKKH